MKFNIEDVVDVLEDDQGITVLQLMKMLLRVQNKESKVYIFSEKAMKDSVYCVEMTDKFLIG